MLRAWASAPTAGSTTASCHEILCFQGNLGIPQLGEAELEWDEMLTAGTLQLLSAGNALLFPSCLAPA